MRRFRWCPPVVASHSRRQGVVPASIREINDSTRRSAEVVVGALRVRVAGTGGIAQDPRRSAASSKGWPESRYHHQCLGCVASRGASLRQPLCGRADCGNPALPPPKGCEQCLLLAKAQGSQFSAAGRRCCDVVEEGAQLLAGIKDQQNPILAELFSELLTEAGPQLVGGGCGHGERRRT